MPISSPWPALRRHFPESQYALLREVRDKAGYSAERSADGIAMNLWPSRGLEVHGIECKAYRSDWTKELKNPQKAENIFQFCDRWWIVAACEGVVKEGEVPGNWGFLQVKNERIYTIREAPKLKPKPLTRDFIAAMLKRATQGMISKQEVDERIADKIAQAKADGIREGSTSDSMYKRESEGYKKIIDDFQAASGIKMNPWDGEEVGKIVKALRETGLDEIKARLMRAQSNMKVLAEDIDKTIAALD